MNAVCGEATTVVGTIVGVIAEVITDFVGAVVGDAACIDRATDSIIAVLVVDAHCTSGIWIADIVGTRDAIVAVSI
jgi:hypothetical protein